MLQHHDISSMLAERPGLLLAMNLHTRQWRTEANAAFDVLWLHRLAAERTVVHQIAAETTRQLFGQDLLLLNQQLLAQRPLEPGGRLIDHGQPMVAALGGRSIVHRSAPFAARSARR